jgi:hypothetical protein
MQSQRTKGFFLINLVIACSLLLIIVSLSVSQTSFFRRFLMRSEVEKLYLLFFYLNQRALVTNKEQTLYFDTTTNSYHYTDKKEQLASALCFGILSHANGPPSNPNKALTQPITFVDDTVHFYPDGTISAGSIYISDNDRGLLYALTISVGHISYLRKYHFSNGSWMPIA